MPEQSSRRAVSWPVAFVVVSALALGAGLFVFERLRTLPADAVREGREVLGDLKQIASAFSSGTVVTSFLSYATEISGSSFFQFASVSQVEVFERTDSQTTMWGSLPLPDVVVRAQAPVTYTYYLDFDAKWELRLEGDTIYVVAPLIEHNRPAVDASGIRYEIKTGSVFRNEDEALERLRDGVSRMAETRANENMALVREMGRRKTARFVEQWLARGFSDAAAHRVVVRFADEEPSMPQIRESEPQAPAAREQP
jgi:hypothetical protein